MARRIRARRRRRLTVIDRDRALALLLASLLEHISRKLAELDQARDQAARRQARRR